jgi:hypothetical protein
VELIVPQCRDISKQHIEPGKVVYTCNPTQKRRGRGTSLGCIESSWVKIKLKRLEECSVVGHLLSMYKALGSSPAWHRKKGKENLL